jgi:tryptophanyl-tRNA synthetase
VSHPQELEDVLQAGAEKARARAVPLMRELRDAVGLRSLATVAGSTKKDKKASVPSFKQYREADGLFYFKFTDAQGRVLVQSKGFASPREAGQCIASMKQAQALPASDVAQLAEGASAELVAQALRALADTEN